ncbi:hypothetical protein CAL14_10945 [Bordetella genomosp. 9]|nr:hypothetical protein CAL14_10945 [Bordetella genomosp. 9]
MQGDGPDEAQLAKFRNNIEGWQDKIAEIRGALYDYPANLKPLSGVMLHLDYHGDLTATRGLIRQEDRETLAAKLRSNAQDEGPKIAAVDLPPVKTRPVHSEALTNRLQAKRVIALQAEIIQRPNLALCLFIEQLLAQVGDSMDRAYQTRSFDFSATSAHHDLERTDAAMGSALAWETVRKEMESHTRDVPGDRQAVLPWLLERAQVDNLGLLAALLATTVYRVRGYNNTPNTRHLDRLAGLVGLDMSKWWSPSVQSYLLRSRSDVRFPIIRSEGTTR